jgi:1-acyl-sn-glycerol-3-phosphate acyltransferase
VRAQVYKDPRPAEYFTRFHERARRRGPDAVYELVRVLLAPLVVLLYRTRAVDLHHVPAHGPAIIAPNHFSFLDHFFVAVPLRRRVQFVAKSQLFRRPLQFLCAHGGVFPVRRGQRDEEAFATAHAIPRRGGVVVMYLEGGRSRSPELGRPRPGVGRLALESGAPVVPTALAGSAGVRDWRRLRFPKVTVRYGAPVRFERLEAPSRDDAQAASEAVFERIRATYEELRRDSRRGVVGELRDAGEPRPAGEARRTVSS